MNQLNQLEKVYLEKYDVHVNPYLTYAQIQQIVNSATQFETWAERQQNIDMLVMLHATDIGIETLQKHTHDDFYTSGLIDVVKKNIKNYNVIQEALQYSERPLNYLIAFTKQLPELEKKLQDVISKHGNVSK